MSNPIGQRNLLFGILALQKNILSADLFAAAMKVWVEKKSKGIAQILREQNALSENQHAVLEELVDDHLARHGNDPQKCLAAVCLSGPARQELEKIADPDVQAGLAQVPTAPIPKPAEAADIIELVDDKPAVAKTPASANMPKTREKSARPKAAPERKRKRMPTWLLVAGGTLIGAVVAVLGSAVVFLAILLAMTLMAKPEHKANPEPLAQNRNEEVKPKEVPLLKKPVEEPPIQVKSPVELAPPPVVVDDDFVPLFNGKDLTGWKPHKQFAGDWRVERGNLGGFAPEGSTGRLYTEKPQPRDFHLRAEVRIGENALGNICFRCPDGTRFGYEVLLSSLAKGDLKVGSVILQNRDSGSSLPHVFPPSIVPGQWFILEIIAAGNHLVVKVDGKTTTDVVDSTFTAPGMVCLAQRTPGLIEFRRIGIKELPAGELLPPAIVEAGKTKAPEFLVELQQTVGPACLSADGLRLAYALPIKGRLAYREAPDFALQQNVVIGGALSPLQMLASSPDGRRLIFSAPHRPRRPRGIRLSVGHEGAGERSFPSPAAPVPQRLFARNGSFWPP